ncbi:hypothetical protein [Kitasatospora paranensis]|uniref:Secreted protein n=1 Tax=Kitasatospora paranensis TaxID=258053 RepID=A0ABW2G6Z1_9ACTN
MQAPLRRALLAVTAASMAAAAPLVLASPAAAATLIGIDNALIDAKVPSRARVDVTYLCDVPAGETSLNVSVEQTDPEDAAAVSFGSTRVAPSTIVCDGLLHTQTVVVQSKTYNWLPDVPAVVVTALSDIGSVPAASADAKKLVLTVAAAS